MRLFQSKPRARLLDRARARSSAHPPRPAFQDLIGASDARPRKRRCDEAWFAEHVAGKPDSAVFKSVLAFGAAARGRRKRGERGRTAASSARRDGARRRASSAPVYRGFERGGLGDDVAAAR